jgi:hypothetical protein
MNQSDGSVSHVGLTSSSVVATIPVDEERAHSRFWCATIWTESRTNKLLPRCSWCAGCVWCEWFT